MLRLLGETHTWKVQYDTPWRCEVGHLKVHTVHEHQCADEQVGH